MKRNNHSVNVGEGDDSDSTISLDLLMIPDCDILRPLDGASIGHPDDGAALEHSWWCGRRARKCDGVDTSRAPEPGGDPKKSHWNRVVVGN